MADYRPVHDKFPLIVELRSDLPGIMPEERPDWLPSDWRGFFCPVSLEPAAVRQWLDWTIILLENLGVLLDDRDGRQMEPWSGDDDYHDAFVLVRLLRRKGATNLPSRKEENFSVPQAIKELLALRDLICADEVGGGGVDTAHSPDFRSLRWFGEVYSFTANQAPVVKCLYENWENGTPDVGDETLLSAVDHDAPPARLSVLFRKHPAWNTLIVLGETKGTKRLAEENTKGA